MVFLCSMKKLVILTGIYLLLSTTVNSQHIRRRAFMGTALINVNDSIAKANQMTETYGILIQTVLDGGTGKKAGLQCGDILININNQKITSKGMFLQLISKMKEGDEILFEFFRNGTLMKTKSKILSPSKDNYDFADVIYDEIPFQGGFLRNIIVTPKGVKKAPVIFFIQGYTCVSIDNLGPDNPYEKIIVELVKKGYAVFKTEKPGMGDCTGTAACEDIDFYTELNAFETAYQTIPKYSFLDTSQIYIFGHSMGGVIAPLIKRIPEAKGIAVYGTVTRSWFEYFIEQARFQQIYAGEDYVDNQANFLSRLRFNYEFLIDKKSLAELAKDSSMYAYLQQEWQWNPNIPDKMSGRNYKFWQQLQDVNLIKSWAEYSGKALAIWGENDFVAFSRTDHEWIADIINHYHPGNGKFVSIPNSDHAFTYNQSMKQAVENWTNGAYRKKNFNPAILKTLEIWLKGN